ncbi:MAG: hypothetical protein PHI90_09325 [Clostridia bacterium]|nr:hypothetical protein [Clostridia bacterium]
MIISIILIATVAKWWTIFWGTPWGKQNAYKTINNYLENTYNQDMTIVNTYYDFKMGIYGGLVRVKANSDITFTVDILKDNSIRDFYFVRLWENNVKEEIAHYVKTIYDGDYIVTVSIPTNPFNALDYESSDSIPSYFDAREKINSEIKFSIMIIKEFNNSDSDYLLILNISKHILKQDYRPDRVNYYFSKTKNIKKQSYVNFELSYTDLENIIVSSDLLKHKK